MKLENDCLRYEIGADGKNLHFSDPRTGTDIATPGSPCAWVQQGGKRFPATTASFAEERLKLQFAEPGIEAVVSVKMEKRYLVFTVESVSNEQIESLQFVYIPLSVKGQLDEPFAGCAVSLNLQTNVPEIPGPNRLLQALCYPRFGLAGAKVAIVGCPTAELRPTLQTVVSAAPDLPHSPLGGPWAMDAPINYGSYLFDTGQMSEDNVDDWVRLCQRLGVTQIDFHGGHSFRFGDCEPNPTLYPKGKASFKAVIDRLHAAGIAAGLHTYAFFIAKTCPWVTPVPDPRLGKDAFFTLAEDMTADTATVPVVETTEKMSAIAGGAVRNSVTLQIDDELITYSDIAKAPPFAFTQCKRGAWGTEAVAHAKNAKVAHLKECFGLFTPDADSTLLTDVAAKTAEMFNDCGFDMIYLDALDGEDILAGGPNAWHYGSKFVFEICKRLNKPALMEMSTFHHHLWFVRSRMEAWDHPNRSHKRFIDQHAAQIDARYRRMFQPGHLGWWAFKTWTDPQEEPTFPDDIEYLCGKCIGNECGLSIMGITPASLYKVPALPRLAAVMKRYENLRQANYFTNEIKDKLHVPGAEYTLLQTPDGEWVFRPIEYDRHKVAGLDGWSNTWKTKNRFSRQPLQLRIEALMSAGPYDAPDNVILTDFTDPKDFPERAAQPGITATLEPSTAQVKVGTVSGCYTVSSTMDTPVRSWSKFRRTCDPTLDLSKHQALGVWVYGDGKGEVLNLQMTDPYSISWGAIADRYIIVDFTGWRYVELVEREGERYADYSWPYGGGYATYRCHLHFPKIETFSLFCNNVPAKGTTTCYLSPIKAIPTVKAKLRNPTITANGKTITFPVEIESGAYLEFHSPADCKLYDAKGGLVAEVKPQGDGPLLEPGDNDIHFTCEAEPGVNPRAYVSVITQGDILRGRNPDDQVKWDFLQREDDELRTIHALDGVQNEWDVICRSDSKDAMLELELVVDRVADGGKAYDNPNTVSIETFDSLDGFADSPENQYAKYVVSAAGAGAPAAPGVTHNLELSTDPVKVGTSSACYTATSVNPNGWSARGRRFAPPLDLSPCGNIGFWVHGDGQGEVLYLQLRDVAGKWHNMNTTVDFNGWKYAEFPLPNAALDTAKVEYLIIFYNNIPAGKTVRCCLDDIRGLRDAARILNPSVSIAEQKLVFPVALGAGDRLLFRQGKDCKLFAVGSKEPKDVILDGTPPMLRPGPNHIQIGLADPAPTEFQLRAWVTKVYR
ncbi:MAG: hypothetical protein A3K19_15545 [Lentisphaerae bacterium RIFOXYB12_FULL_65_16]|nr:MAG: hypothetical protein A3K18_26400 [Lentisphaerae bacterium RIFOXYA12_64_32]OGV88511.1 MAG: hypothetical protein A3K19_15545 [Lentisphaerae bacterium RIFOXYB12_FULL_65_16]